MSPKWHPKADANGWVLISEVEVPSDMQVMYFYPKKGKGFEANVGFGGFISPYQWWKPTHWQPKPEGPVDAVQEALL